MCHEEIISSCLPNHRPLARRETSGIRLAGFGSDCAGGNSAVSGVQTGVEAMTKYKEGDLLTFKLQELDCQWFNANHNGSYLLKSQIIKHEPAPEPKPPVIAYFTADEVTIYGGWASEDIVRIAKTPSKVIIKLTWNLDTRTVSAEVVG